jgi:hypothetical protein
MPYEIRTGTLLENQKQFNYNLLKHTPNVK